MATPWSADPNPALAGLFISLAVYLLAIIWFFMGTFRRVSLTTQTPLVSVVLAARDEAGTIEATLNSLLEQSYEPLLLEVILVDD
ncbi:MAG: glycosyltransferase, partial [Candidatus Latescibacterota bacterium]|nr:glycosyltransferase [Candidatus Latescibacterota bacterium]